MPTDASGNYTLPVSYFVENGNTILPVQHNPPFEDLQQGMTDRVMRNGSAAMTADLNMDANKIVGLADGVGVLDAVNMGQIASFAKVNVANTWTVTQTFDASGGQEIILKSRNANAGAAFMRFQDSDGDNIGFVGMGGSGDDTVSLARNTAGALVISAGSGAGTITVTGVTTFVNNVLVPDGSVSAPSIALSSETGTGTYRVAAGNLGLTVGGTHVAHWNSTGYTISNTSGATAFGSVDAVKNLISGGGQIDVTNTTGGAAMRLSRSGSDGIVEQFHRNATLVGNVSVTTTTCTFNSTSDGRLKENFEGFDSGEIIDAIEVYRFNWKVDGSVDYGPIAQDLHAVFPQAVQQGSMGDGPGDETFEPWSYDASKLVPVLIKEIQSLRARLDAANL